MFIGESKLLLRGLKFSTLDRLNHKLRSAQHILILLVMRIGTLSKDDDGSEVVGRKMNLRSFKLNRVYLDLFNKSNAGDFSWS